MEIQNQITAGIMGMTGASDAVMIPMMLVVT